MHTTVAMSLRVIVFILKALCFLLAALFIFLIVYAQLNCSIFPSIGYQCHGPDLDIWMLPFFYAPLGIPTLLASIGILIVGVVRRWRRSRGKTSA
jgi:hypothetical protein